MRAAISVDPEIVNFYRTLIPKYYNLQAQMHTPHITVVRIKKETPTNLEVWAKYQGQIIPFQYDSMIHFDGTYWYLDIHSLRIGEIREELGLPRFRKRKYEDFFRCYHLTIGNSKEKDYN